MGFSRFRALSIGAALALLGVASIPAASATRLHPFVVNASQVTTGGDHSCALTTSGGVQCWGADYYGQLGDGGSGTSTTPVAVSGLSSGVVAITAGALHTCALTTGGAVKCWGYNGDGELGDGTGDTSYVPVTVSGMSSGIAAVSAGAYHTCAVTTAGAAKCWGDGYSGQLGTGGAGIAYSPASVVGLSSGIANISAGGAHTCALTTSGGVKCWGYGGYGQLGTGSNSTYYVPQDVSGLTSGVAAVSAGGYHTCAVTTGGGARCWGQNYNGQLGLGYYTYAQYSPVTPSGMSSGVAEIDAGYYHTCAVSTGGAATCWGYGGYGQVGDGSSSVRYGPVSVFGLSSGVAHVSAGGPSNDYEYYGHTCATLTSGGVRCWGYNGNGQIGDGTYQTKYIPTAVTLGSAPPGAPTSVAGTGGNGSIDVAFAAPSDQGSSAISSFTATCTSSNGGTLGSQEGSDSPILVSGLTNAKTYTCTVHATNSFGDGPESSPSAAVIPLGAKPGPPTSVTASPGNAQITVSFQAPSDSGSTSITSYTATCDSDDGGASGGASGAGSPLVVTSLTNGKTYSCTVHATNSIGDGPESLPSDSVVPTSSVIASIGGVTAYEGDVGSHSVEFAVTLSNPATSTVTVQYSVAKKVGDTATPGSDFIATTGTLTFQPIYSGKTPTVAYVPVTIKGDTTTEKNETFTVTLTAATGATLGRTVSRAAITNDDPGTGIRVSVSNAGLVEGNSAATVGGANKLNVHVLLSRPVPSGKTVTVRYTVTGVTAKGGSAAGNGVDFVQVTIPATLTFKAGQQDKIIYVKTFPDTLVEPNETFNVTITSVTGAKVLNGIGVGTIRNDD